MAKKFSVFSWLWSLVILVLTLSPGSTLPKFGLSKIIPLDKIAHFLIFLFFAWLIGNSFHKESRSLILNRKPKTYSFLLAFIYGISIELIQSMIPDRSFELEDIAANTAGCLAGVLLIRMK
ncbi:MAG: VanZ family protein [Cytophagaceae bacterium]